MEINDFNLSEKELKQIRKDLNLYSHVFSYCGISLEEKPLLKRLLNLFSPCDVSLNK